VTRRILMGAVLVLAVVLVGWFEGFSQPESHHLANLKQQEQVAAGKVTQLDAQYIALVHSEKQLPAERAALAALALAVPSGPELDNIVKSLWAAADASGVELTDISSPQPAGFGVPTPASVTGPVELELNLSVSGTAGQVEALVNHLDAEWRLFVVDSFSLQNPSTNSPHGAAKASGSGVTGGSSLTLRAFYAIASSDNPAS
jgi:Tfp pilus assembly protein PilO